MSSEGENGKNLPSQVDGKNDESEEKAATKNAENDVKNEANTQSSAKSDKDNGDEDVKKEEKPDEVDKSEEKPKKEEPEDTKKENDEKKDKENDKVKKNDSKDDGSEDEDEGSNDDEEEEEDKDVEEKSTKKKASSRTDDDTPEKDNGKIEIPDGSGTNLGDIARIDASISRFKNDDLKLLHKLLFKMPGKATQIKKNIKKFNGFDFKKDSDEYGKKIAAAQKFELKQLKSICEMLDLEKKGNKDEIAERIIDFLMEPKDSGKAVGGGRPKRTAAVRANNRGYSSHDDSYSSDERHATRARRDKGRRANLKDESSSESDEDFHPSDASEEEKPPVKSRRGRKKAQSDDDASEMSESGSEDSDDEPRNKKKAGNKVANNRQRGRPPASGRGRGRKPGAAAAKKSAPGPKRGRKRKETSSEEEEDESDHLENEGSSSEDEPLAKKTKTSQPPTDEEIKTYVKEILDGANLEEITMKTVCKQVYAHYPDFDLAHKKDFIKTTVKSLIST